MMKRNALKLVECHVSGGTFVAAKVITFLILLLSLYSANAQIEAGETLHRFRYTPESDPWGYYAYLFKYILGAIVSFYFLTFGIRRKRNN